MLRFSWLQTLWGNDVPAESIAGLVRDMTTQLSTMAAEFQVRADRLTADGTEDASPDTASPSTRALAVQLLTQRAARFDHFADELFHEPAWDMLLALFIAQADHRTMNVKTLVATAQAPVTTSQRWIDHLHKLNLIDRTIDPADRRRVEISLSDAGHQAILAYLQQLGAV